MRFIRADMPCTKSSVNPRRSQAAQPVEQAHASAPRQEQSGAQAAASPSNSADSQAARFCDVVMEGGVTSGIVYASAAAELAKHYHFRSIGGSSIGAFAAALTAAAEYSRRCGSLHGFRLLETLPEELAKEDRSGNTVLRNLFRPQEKTRRLFAIFLATIGHDTLFWRLLNGFVAALWQYRLRVTVAVLVTAALVLGPLALIWLGWIGPPIGGIWWKVVALGAWGLALLMALALTVTVALGCGIARDVRLGLVPNGFGLCRGWARVESSDPPDLAGYMHEAIQKAAGRKPDGPPLTFKDLWEAPGAPDIVFGYPANEAARRSINLEVYATNLAHGRPYRFPLDPADDMGRLFFCLEEMEQYFPPHIVQHLADHARPYRPQTRSDPTTPTHPERYLELPREHLPIVVAARLAISFPLLISAVPLWAIDFEPRRRSERGLSRCWMSDGGLCSNFPIHLFDSFLPRWPTFGISLQTRGKHWSGDPVWMAERHYQGGGDTWHRIEGRPLKQLFGFLVGLWLATWRWNDTTMMRMPAVRDRVVSVLLRENEGGVNIKMTGNEIRNLATTYGKPAAQEFIKKFVEGEHGWPEHRWVRLNRLLIALRQQMEGFCVSAEFMHHTQPMQGQIEASRLAAPLRGYRRPCGKPRPSEEPLRPEQVSELSQLLAALLRLERSFVEAGNHAPYEAEPRPSLRIRHPT
jgi:predicted acylesterase/phospholipase RssA